MATLHGFSREYLLTLFDYDPATGVVRNKVQRGSRALPGEIAGTKDGKGYLHVFINGKFLRLHRLVYFLATGELPSSIDHINRRRTDNRLANLRPATQQQNSGNSGVARHNTSGFRGVSRNTKSGKWHAQIKIGGKQTYLGRFDTPEEAAQAYDLAALFHFGEYATLNYA